MLTWSEPVYIFVSLKIAHRDEMCDLDSLVGSFKHQHKHRSLSTKMV
jgi:hypothetical protein